MKRTNKKKKADAILTADIHLSDSPPISRTDDYLAAQSKKLNLLCDLQSEHGCPVLDAGDIFNHWKPSPWLLSKAYTELPEYLYTIPGNHDLPEHSNRLYYKSGLAVLEEVEALMVFPGLNEARDRLIDNGNVKIYICAVPYGDDLVENIRASEDIKVDRRILIIHDTVWPGVKPPWPGAEGYSAQTLLRQYGKHFDLILSGHNHTGFTESHKDSILVNPGSMMRISADKADYKPRCYLYYADTNEVKPIYYPIEQGVHDDSHIVQPKERDERLTAYIEKMNMEWESGLSFRDNLEAFFKRNKTTKKVRELIWHNLET